MKKLLLMALSAIMLTSCGGDDDNTSSGTATEEAPASAEMRILVVGDSICTGYGVATGWGNHLKAKGYNVVRQECQRSREAPHVAGAVAGWTAAADATHVLILLGTNDAIRGSVSGALNALQTMTNAARSYGAQAVIGTLPPITRNSGWDVRAARISAGMGGVNGARVADIRSRFNGAMLADGIHPNDIGQDVIANAFAAQIQ